MTFGKATKRTKSEAWQKAQSASFRFAATTTSPWLFKFSTSPRRQRTLQQQSTRINALRDALLVGDHNWIAGITYRLKSLGIGNNIPMLPLQPVDDARKALIDSLQVRN